MAQHPTPHEDRAPQTEPLRLASRDISRGIANAMTLAEIQGRVTLLERRGQPVCAIVPLQLLARLQQAGAQPRTDAAAAEEASR